MDVSDKGEGEGEEVEMLLLRLLTSSEIDSDSSWAFASAFIVDVVCFLTDKPNASGTNGNVSQTNPRLSCVKRSPLERQIHSSIVAGATTRLPRGI